MKKIKLYIDAEVLVAEHFSGIGHYTLELLRGVDALIEDRTDIKVVLVTFYKRVNIIQSYKFRNLTIRRSPFFLRLSNSLKIRGLQPFYDLFFGKGIYLFPNYTSWPLLFSRSLSIVYDLSFFKFPEYVEPRNQKFLAEQVTKSVRRSTKTLTISKNSQSEIIEHYNITKGRVPILHPGVDQSVFYRRPEKQIATVKARYGIHGKYILFTGNIEPRKNLRNLLLAYERLPDKVKEEYSLLIVGARGWLDGDIFDTIRRLRIAGDRIQQPLDYVKDEDRPAIYSGASLFIYPSLYEGFGIPPLEAMACGVPTITSDNSSLPEAVGRAAIKIDAKDVNAIKETMVKVLTDINLQNSLVGLGYKQVDKFNWTVPARQLLDIVKEVSGI